MIRFMEILTARPKQPNTSGTAARFERKFYIPASKIAFASHLLAHCCVRDAEYPGGVVHSLYYDTDDMDCYQDSDDGHYARHKVRIRWYDSPNGTPETPVYLELKSKNGFAGTKQRSRRLVASELLGNPDIAPGPAGGILDGAALREGLSQFDYFPQKRYRPVIIVSYDRRRFRDLLTGTRVSLDWNIRSAAVTPRLGPCAGPVRLSGGVIEIKGPSADIPATLRSMALLDTDWSRYSKYGSCVEAHLEGLGSVGRLRPSGRMERL